MGSDTQNAGYGSDAGSVIGGVLGSVVAPGLGTVIGSAAGNALGGEIGSAFGPQQSSSSGAQTAGGAPITAYDLPGGSLSGNSGQLAQQAQSQGAALLGTPAVTQNASSPTASKALGGGLGGLLGGGLNNAISGSGGGSNFMNNLFGLGTGAAGDTSLAGTGLSTTGIGAADTIPWASL